MMHPDTEFKLVNETIGYGVFATAFIPAGTIVYIRDAMEVVIPAQDTMLTDPRYRDVIDKYSYIDGEGNHIISWDHAKYVNHCCQCNTMSTGWGFEIAVRDIQAGEEITDEYGIFNMSHEMELKCCKDGCRGKLTPQDFELYGDQWDQTIQSAMKKMNGLAQPLMAYMDPKKQKDLDVYLKTGKGYRSIKLEKYDPAASGRIGEKNILRQQVTAEAEV